MIEIKYKSPDKMDDVDFSYSTEENASVISESNDVVSEGNISGEPIKSIQDKLKINEPIINFASFFGKGINLNDRSIQLGTKDDYFGYIPKYDRSVPQELTITFDSSGGKVAPKIVKGITVFFHKYICKFIYVAIEGNLIAEINNNDSETVFIPLSLDSWQSITIGFWDFFENQPICLKGIIIDAPTKIEDIYSYDSIVDINPTGEDLSINENNIQFVSNEDILNDPNYIITFHENGVLLQQHYIKKINEEEGIFDMKTRSILTTLEKENRQHNVRNDISSTSEYDVHDWNNYSITLRNVIENDLKFPAEVSVPESFLDIELSPKLSPFLKYCSVRKYIQQLAWASCCGIDTTESEGIEFVPFFATETTKPDITISNDDDKILKTAITKGEEYKSIVWEFPIYKIPSTTSDAIVSALEVLGNVSIKGSVLNENRENGIDTFVVLRFDEPSIPIENSFATHGVRWVIEETSPYSCKLKTQVEFGAAIDDDAYYSAVVKGIKYASEQRKVEIPISENGEVLTISNQELYPIDLTNKKAQLKKWYSKNNTLRATVVDNNNEIKLGKVIKIQLRNGNYFQGIITQVHRNTINTYHTVELEAHEWN